VKVAVIGAGSWGTTLASLVARNAEVVLWALEPEIPHHIHEHHTNPLYLPGIPLDERLRATTGLEDALGSADAVISAVPSEYLRSVMQQAEPFMPTDVPILSVTKGIERVSLKRPTEVIADVLSHHDRARVGVLSGPNIARDVAEGQPAATVVAMPDQASARSMQGLIMTPSFRVYTNPDVVGCELGGAVKNVIALAAGMADGLGFGDTTKAALITRGLAELTRLGVQLGGRPLTFLGLAGNGDLIVTCVSHRSRNHHVGEQLGRGRALDAILGEMNMVAEGVKSAPAVLELAHREGVVMPICEQVGAVLFEGRSPTDALRELMTRDPAAELHGMDETK
jgi:glycerol-3-phosphate dehydrogenase (NAD(P)+)